MLDKLITIAKSIVKPKTAPKKRPVKPLTERQVKALEINLLQNLHPGLQLAQAVRLSTRLGKKRRYKR